jgi:hypothetical protein
VGGEGEIWGAAGLNRFLDLDDFESQIPTLLSQRVAVHAEKLRGTDRVCPRVAEDDRHKCEACRRCRADDNAKAEQEPRCRGS